MNKVEVEFIHCFGIPKFQEVFDFENCKSVLVYASNGIMKTSFANSFREISHGRDPVDRIHNKPSSYAVLCDGRDIEREEILVIKSFEEISSEGPQSKLLVDPESKKEYDSIFAEIDSLRSELILKLNKQSGVPKPRLESVMLSDLGLSNIFDLKRVIDDVTPQNDYSSIKYKDVCNPDVEEFLDHPDVKPKIEEYFKTYKGLIEKSSIFKEGVFDPNMAIAVGDTLGKENFFHADHKVLLKGVENEITSKDDYDKVLREERKAIVDNDELVKIETQIKKVAVKKLPGQLDKGPILTELGDIPSFKKKLWRSYLVKEQFLVHEILEKYTSSKNKILEIEEKARAQKTTWDDVVAKFNDRFTVPFEVSVVNKESAILKNAVPKIVFSFRDEVTGNIIQKSQNEINSQEFLSQGERRAMYLLNILFNIEAKKAEGGITLLIIDDIADSFDYRNKYAIIQYLSDLSQEDAFRQIILTHNYDFFRTVQSRILGGSAVRDNSFIAQKNQTEVKLIGHGHNYQIDPFKYWRNNLGNPAFFLASIPFVRNLVEFKRDGTDDFNLLTSVLHYKSTSDQVDVGAVIEILRSNADISGEDVLESNEKVLALIDHQADQIYMSNIDFGLNLEKKIVLSLACRLTAEKYMWSKVTDQTEFNKNQTAKLYNRFKAEFGEGFIEEKDIIDQVLLITPENIHVNSFMFEPILDLSIDHLKQLYQKVKSLN